MLLFRPAHWLWCCGILVSIGLGVLPAAPPVPPAPPDAAQAGPVIAPPPQTTVTLALGHSQMITPRQPVRRVAVADPKIADVQVLSPTQVLLIGKAVGSTDLILWGEKDHAWQTRVQVEVDATDLKKQLEKFFPGARLTLTQRNDVLVVSGSVRRAEHVKQISEFLASSGAKYVNMVTLAGVQQVMIQVRLAEASRDAIRALGINAVYSGSDFFGGSTIGGNPNGINIGPPAGAAVGAHAYNWLTNPSISPDVTLFGGFPKADLQLFLSALAENQYMRVLAEPTLVAASGEEASFLAGGEFPVPIVQGTTTGGGTSITIEFKEFGVRLRFRPVVLGDGTIRLTVAPEVSNLSNIGAVQMQGFSIPSIQTRRAQTTLEMHSGQTFAMAGLIDRRINAISDSVPALGSVPVLGALFRSVRYEEGDTELVVLATVNLVSPLSITHALPLPGDVQARPTDWELYADGRIEGKTPPPISPADAHALRAMGLDRLQGPGAWAVYGQEPAAPNAPSTFAPPGRGPPPSSTPVWPRYDKPKDPPAPAPGAPGAPDEKPAPTED